MSSRSGDKDTPGQVSFLRFVTTRTRDPDAPVLQLAQFVAYGAQVGEPHVPGERKLPCLTLVDARNLGGDSPAGEGPGNVFDGKYDTKWVDANKGALECRIASGPTKVSAYYIVPANDDSGSDPVRWRVEGRLGEGGEWRVLDDQNTGSDQRVPENRSSASGTEKSTRVFQM
mmetsp:Transcript_32282/g.76173  ORF Transcript_32282/g.76173 Transcript_32282/m.76173 type:complete len:172 (-) Transcript_32282:199-714(-)